MNYLTLPFFKALLQKREAQVVLGFSLFPLLLIVVSLFDTNFMQLTATEGGLSFFEFFGAVLITQYGLFLPIVVFIYLASHLFRDEINSGLMYLYKDQDRKKILNAKLGSLLLLQFFYTVLTLISSFVTYFLHLVRSGIGSGEIFPASIDFFHVDVLNIIGITTMTSLCILVASGLSIRLSNGLTMLLATLFTLLSYIAPLLTNLKYLFPNSYSALLGELNFSTCLLLMVFLVLFYVGILYLVSLYYYRKIEY